MPPNKKGVEVKCPNCDYAWRRRSKLIVVKCPNCGSNFHLPKKEN